MKLSAGLLVYKYHGDELQVLLVHPGGPFWVNKDSGAWSIPKGEYLENEDPLSVAYREFREETGQSAPKSEPTELGTIKQPSGKRITAWAVEGEVDVSNLKSNLFELEWPPKSKIMQKFPEVDKAEWFSLRTAQQKILSGQIGFLENLETLLA